MPVSDPGGRPRGRGGRIDVSIVIPVFNEERRLEPGLELLKAAISWGTLPGRTIEIVVVDDGSTDRTSGRADRCLSWFPEAQLVQLPENLGKGAAVRAGVAAARGAVVVFTDVDMAVHPAHLTELVGALDHGDVVMGSRSHHQSRVVDSTRHRQLMGVAFHRIVRSVTELPYRDTQCGFKAFRTPVARMLFHCSSTYRFAFDVELLTTARAIWLPNRRVAGRLASRPRESNPTHPRSCLNGDGRHSDPTSSSRRRRPPCCAYFEEWRSFRSHTFRAGPDPPDPRSEGCWDTRPVSPVQRDGRDASCSRSRPDATDGDH